MELVAERHGVAFKRVKRRYRALAAEIRVDGERAVLLRPTTFMNESGQGVVPPLRYYKTDLDRMLVVHDDIDLPFAKVRVQLGRSHGGNNGVRSLIKSLGSTEFWRLKMGVGRPPGTMDPADYVLRRFRRAERPDVERMLDAAVEIVETFVRGGGEAARQRAGELNVGG